MYIQETLVTDKQIALELSSENGRYRLPIDGQDYYFPTLEKVHKAFLQQDTYDTIKLTHNGKKSYLHLLMDELEVFDTKEALRQRLSQDSQGLWAEIRNGKKHYYMQQRGWTSTSYKEITEQECLEKLKHTSTMTKVLGIGLGILALLPGAVEFARHFPIGSKEAAMGLIALNQKNPVLGAVGYSLLPTKVEAQAMGTEFQINTYTTDQQDSPTVTALANGGFVVTWNSFGQDGSDYGVYGQIYTKSGLKKGAEFRVNTYTTNSQAYSSIAALSDGDIMVTWHSDGQDGDGTGIFGQRFDGSGAKSGAEFQVNTYTTSSQSDPSVVALANGGFVVTWYSDGQDGSGYGVYGQRYDSNSAKIGVEFQVNSYTTSHQRYPAVAAFSDGGFVVTWHSDGQDGDLNGIFGQRYDSSGLKSGAEFQINTYTTGNQWYSSVAALADGGFVVAWESQGQDGDGDGIYGQWYDASGVKGGTEFQVNTYTTNDQWYPTVTDLADGGFVVTRGGYGQAGSGYGIYGQRYDSGRVKTGGEFQVNTYTTTYHLSSFVAGLADGGFVVTWYSYPQDGSSYGAYGQRYDASGNPIPLELPISTIVTPTASPTQVTASQNTPTSAFQSTQSALISSTPAPSNTPSQTPTTSASAVSPSTVATASSRQTPSREITTSSAPPSETPLKTSTAHTSSTRSSVAPVSNTQAAVSTKSSPTPLFSSTESGPTSSTSSPASVAQIIYGESYPILVNDHVVGSYTVSGGSGLLDSNNSNVIFFEFDPNFQPVEGEVITLFTIPDEEVGLWESIQIEGESIECLQPHGYVDTKLEGSSYQIIFDETTCLAIAPTLLANTLPLTLN